MNEVHQQSSPAGSVARRSTRDSTTGSPARWRRAPGRRSGYADCHRSRVKCKGGYPAAACVLNGKLDGVDSYCVRNVSGARFPTQSDNGGN